MAIGDNADMAVRLRSLLPGRWFPNDPIASPILSSLLSGLAEPWSWLFQLLAFIKLQQRIGTAQGIFLDVAALDYLGDRFQREDGQDDNIYRRAVQLEILRPRVTRAAMIGALTTLTGRAPTIFEFAQPNDTGGYDSGNLGYDVAGGYGEIILPYQALVTAYRPKLGGIAGLAGYDTPYGGYDGGRIMYAGSSDTATVTDQMIINTVTATRAAGTLIWMRIADNPPSTIVSITPPVVDPLALPLGRFVLGISDLA